MSEPPRLYTPKDVARLLQVSVDTVRRQMQSGRLRFVRVGDQIRFRPADVRSYIDGQASPRPARRRKP